MRKLLFATALLAGLGLPGLASAQERAFVTGNLNVRVGPDVTYARIATIPGGDDVLVFGCVAGYLWCDISWAGLRGWVYADYLAFLRDDRRYEWRTHAPRFDFPIISFSFGDYNDRWYKDRPWYRHRSWNNDWNDRWDRDRGKWWNNDRSPKRVIRRDNDNDRRVIRRNDDNDRRVIRRDNDNDRRVIRRNDDNDNDRRVIRRNDDNDKNTRRPNVRDRNNTDADQNWNTWGAGQSNGNQGGRPPYR